MLSAGLGEARRDGRARTLAGMSGDATSAMADRDRTLMDERGRFMMMVCVGGYGLILLVFARPHVEEEKEEKERVVELDDEEEEEEVEQVGAVYWG